MRILFLQGLFENELEFSPGDIVYVTEKSNGPLWKGECNGQVGVFPNEFVEEGILNHSNMCPFN